MVNHVPKGALSLMDDVEGPHNRLIHLPPHHWSASEVMCEIRKESQFIIGVVIILKVRKYKNYGGLGDLLIQKVDIVTELLQIVNRIEEFGVIGYFQTLDINYSSRNSPSITNS
jgi:hypothetical protein